MMRWDLVGRAMRYLVAAWSLFPLMGLLPWRSCRSEVMARIAFTTLAGCPLGEITHPKLLEQHEHFKQLFHGISILYQLYHHIIFHQHKQLDQMTLTTRSNMAASHHQLPIRCV